MGRSNAGWTSLPGGVDLYLLTTDGIGLAVVADSLAAIEQRVVQEKRLSWEALAQHMRSDYVNAEQVRLMLRNIPRFGTGGSRADEWAKRVAGAYTDLVRGTPTPHGFTILPGLFSHGGIAQYGEKLGATPNGRRSGQPVSHSANPDPGFMPDGGAGADRQSQCRGSRPTRLGQFAPLQLDVDAHLLKEYGWH